jgi:hypothetical protein
VERSASFVADVTRHTSHAMRHISQVAWQDIVIKTEELWLCPWHVHAWIRQNGVNILRWPEAYGNGALLEHVV